MLAFYILHHFMLFSLYYSGREKFTKICVYSYFLLSFCLEGCISCKQEKRNEKF